MVLIGGYATWWMHQVVGLPLPVSIIGGLIVGAIVSWITFEIFINPFYKRHRFLPLVTTIALSMMLDGMILLMFEDRPRSIIPGLSDPYVLMGVRISQQQILLILVTLLTLVAFAYLFHSTTVISKETGWF